VEKQSDLDRIVSVAHEVAEAAGNILLSRFGNAGIREKAVNELVTEADIESEQAAKAIILREFPQHQILAEEEGTAGGSDSSSLWIIDPLDGTNNYAQGIPHFSVSIAFARKGEIQAGIVFDPHRGEKFVALRGQGAWLNDQTISVSKRPLSQSIVATGFYYDRGELVIRTLDSIRRLFEANVRGVRRFGSAALDLAWVACGRLDGFFEYRLAPWDYSAGALLVAEAGGECRDRGGASHHLQSRSIVSTNSVNTEAMLRCVQWSS
jgi:myo-inositol-1(or 4)-monophosphatase